MKSKKPVYTLAAVAKSVHVDPKTARAKFRRLKKERPFDHTKVKQLSSAQVNATKKFLKADFRNNA